MTPFDSLKFVRFSEFVPYENRWCSKPDCIGCTDADTCYSPDDGMHECNNCWWIEYQLDNGLLEPMSPEERSEFDAWDVTLLDGLEDE